MQTWDLPERRSSPRKSAHQLSGVAPRSIGAVRPPEKAQVSKEHEGRLVLTGSVAQSGPKGESNIITIIIFRNTYSHKQ